MDHFPLKFKALILKTRGVLVFLNGKTIPVTGRGGLYVCETSRLPHFLDNRLTDGGEVVSRTHLPRVFLTILKIYSGSFP
jgi:hypothetical protein